MNPCLNNYGVNSVLHLHGLCTQLERDLDYSQAVTDIFQCRESDLETKRERRKQGGVNEQNHIYVYVYVYVYAAHRALQDRREAVWRGSSISQACNPWSRALYM